jgi:hypothetical protein
MSETNWIGRSLMNKLSVRLRRLLFGISPDEASAARRGFEIRDQAMRARLDLVGITFIRGYSMALEARSLDDLGLTLDSVDLEWRGFAYEGAAMALALLDYITPGSRNKLGRFLRGPGDRHRYMVHVGAGWAIARVPLRTRSAFRHLDPMLKWLAIDGLGFHEGYFHWSKYRNGKEGGKRPAGYGAHAFDQGLGRSLWFVNGGDVSAMSTSISQFSEARRPDLWSGIGLACAYAGALSIDQLNELKAAAGAWVPSLAQGAAFAAKARERAGNQTAHTENACRVLCGTSASAAAALTDYVLNELKAAELKEALSDSLDDSDTPRYEVWRKRIAAAFAEERTIGRHRFEERETIRI